MTWSGWWYENNVHILRDYNVKGNAFAVWMRMHGVTIGFWLFWLDVLFECDICIGFLARYRNEMKVKGREIEDV